MSATLLTVSELREHLETDLSDEALQRILNAEEAEIVRRCGASSTGSETLEGNDRYLFLTRPATAISSVVETESDNLTQTTLAANDYRLHPNGKIERLLTGTNPRQYWAHLVTVNYVPVDMAAQSRLVLLQLATLAAKYNALKSEAVGGGDYSRTSLDYAKERESLLRSLASHGIWIV